MDIAQAKAEIARRAFSAGYVFDPSEIIDGPLEDKTLVFLRSVRAFRTIENDDGSFSFEEFNSPIIWIDMPHPMLTKQEINGLNVHISIPESKVRILHPEFTILI